MKSLLETLEELRALLRRPENDFSWSSWKDSDEAIQEVDRLIARIAQGQVPNKTEMDVLFAPTGPAQEVSLSSGWSAEFLKLAVEFDQAVFKARVTRPNLLGHLMGAASVLLIGAASIAPNATRESLESAGGWQYVRENWFGFGMLACGVVLLGWWGVRVALRQGIFRGSR